MKKWYVIFADDHEEFVEAVTVDLAISRACLLARRLMNTVVKVYWEETP